MARRGRKRKFTKKMLRIARDMFEEGASDLEVAKACKIATSTFYEYLHMYPEFSEVRKIGRRIDAARVENSLSKRARGYEYEEKVIEVRIGSDGEEKPALIKKTKKHIPPDVGACAFILKNKNPDEWKDKHEFDASIEGLRVSLEGVKSGGDGGKDE